MANTIATKSVTAASAARPFTTSYDSGYEHSLEHWLDTQRLVEEATEFKAPASVPVAATTRAS